MAAISLLATLTVGTTPTATRLTATRTPCAAFMVQADPANTDVIWFGDSTVSSANKKGIRLEIPIAGGVLPAVSVPGGAAANALNLADYYVISPSASQKVNVFYMEL